MPRWRIVEFAVWRDPCCDGGLTKRFIVCAWTREAFATVFFFGYPEYRVEVSEFFEST
jgi:hypothetical protein